MYNINIVYDKLTHDEKILDQIIKSIGLNSNLIDIKELSLYIDELKQNKQDKAFIIRCKNYWNEISLSKLFETQTDTLINPPKTIELSNNNLKLTSFLQKHNLPFLRTVIAFSEQGFIKAIKEHLGFPVNIISLIENEKLSSLVYDDNALESIVEHKWYLKEHNRVYIAQEYIPAENVFSVHWLNNRCIGAIKENKTFIHPQKLKEEEPGIYELSEKVFKLCQGKNTEIEILKTSDEKIVITKLKSTPSFKLYLQSENIIKEEFLSMFSE